MNERMIAGVALLVLLAGAPLVRAETECPQPAQIAPAGVPAPLPVVRLARAPATPAELALPVTIWTDRRTTPEPLAIYVLRVDLRAPALEVIAMPAEDPDGAGPAEAALTDPRELAERYRALAAVNANAFAGIPGPNGKEDSRWRPGLPVDIAGLAVSGGKVRSTPDARSGTNLCFWLDGAGRPHIGPYPGAPAEMREGIHVWWIDLVAEGRVLPQPGGDRHPRTALGLDADGRWLLLVVVDGRQPGKSVGMTAQELGALMAGLGCQRAINLDGGGSSILLAADRAGALEIINRPSGGQSRPVPILLGVRARTDGTVPTP
jgi:exopolysaccharide biosynthesis protein